MKIGSSTTSLGAFGLARTVASISRSLERLSTGRRVNRPGDDPAGFALAQRLGSQVRGLNESVRGAHEAIGFVETAETAYQSQLDLVRRMREIALQGASTTISSATRAALTKELQGLLDEYKKISNSTTFKGLNPLSGDGITMALGTQGELTHLELLDGDAASTMVDYQGAGAFEASKTFGAATTQNHLVDINGDGNLDFVGTTNTGGTNWIRVNLSDGQGNFSATKTYGQGLEGLAVGDFDGDGALDVVTSGDGDLVLYAGGGDGTFAHAQTIDTTWQSGFVESADVDNDGDLDLIQLNNPSAGGGIGDIHIVLNDGAGTFTPLSTISLIQGGLSIFISATALETGDFDGDGNTDWMAHYSYDNGSFYSTIEVAYGNGDGTFAAASTKWEALKGLEGVANVADINKDGFDDIALPYSTSAVILKGTGSASFVTATMSNVFSAQPNYLTLNDYDSDGHIDLIASRYNVVALDGAWGIKKNPALPFSSGAAAPLVGDLNGDGINDVVGIGAALQTIFLQRSTAVSGLGSVSIESTDKAERLIRILDNTIDNLTTNLGQAAAVHSRLDHYAAGSLLMSETMEQARLRTLEVDFALETAELVRLQILQDAQIAVRAQANVQLQQIIMLLNSL